MSFSDFVQKFKLKNKAISNIKKQQVLGSIGLDNVGIYLRDGPFSGDIGIVNLHPYRTSHWFYTETNIILIVTIVYVQKNYLYLL